MWTAANDRRLQFRWRRLCEARRMAIGGISAPDSSRFSPLRCSTYEGTLFAVILDRPATTDVVTPEGMTSRAAPFPPSK